MINFAILLLAIIAAFFKIYIATTIFSESKKHTRNEVQDGKNEEL